jgi:hypothetical protein
MNVLRKSDLRHFRDLEVYQKAFQASMKIFEMTKGFPSEEKFALVDQIRRSSRSVCANLAEGWRKRKYIAVFKNKLTDSMQGIGDAKLAGILPSVPLYRRERFS